jgi:hypothetical protein
MHIWLVVPHFNEIAVAMFLCGWTKQLDAQGRPLYPRPFAITTSRVIITCFYFLFFYFLFFIFWLAEIQPVDIGTFSLHSHGPASLCNNGIS